MTAIAIGIACVAAAVLTIWLFVRMARRGGLSEGEANAQLEALELSAKQQRRIDKVRAAPIPLGARNAFEHFLRVRAKAASGVQAASKVPRAGSDSSDSDGNGSD